jgi:hypothetical protein
LHFADHRGEVGFEQIDGLANAADLDRLVRSG